MKLLNQAVNVLKTFYKRPTAVTSFTQLEETPANKEESAKFNALYGKNPAPPSGFDKYDS
jgi:hypothetical protein